ncbi:MAG: thioredoxin-disulfide reductase [Thermodesulfovibrionia bacterium]|nr:thioredoxin-disulfide reductase [Thermodesulfovibrionia bacterium]
MSLDVIIIGGGPAGLTAGLYASRARLKTLLIEKGFAGGQVMTTEWVENYPGFEEGISGAELSQRFEKHATKFGLDIVQGSVTEVSLKDKVKRITLENGMQYESKTVILATGASPKLLNIAGEGELRGKGVSYCAICDGAFFKGEKLAVIGGGDSAVEEAMFLTRFADMVYIVHRRDRFRAAMIAQERASSNPKVKFILDSVPERIEGESGVKALHIKNVKTGERTVLDVHGVFIYVGYNPNSAFLKGIVRLDDKGYIISDDKMSTSAPGVYGVGDIRAGSLKQICTAVGDGATAAMSAEKYIEHNFNED